MKNIITILLFLVSASAYAQYNPQKHTLTNKPLGIAQAVPTDARSYYYDTTLFKYRPYQSTTEVNAYLTLSKYRTGQFSVFTNSGTLDTLGDFTGGSITEYWYKNGVADTNLVVKIGSGGSTYAAGWGLTLTGVTFKVDTSLVATRYWVQNLGYLTSIAGITAGGDLSGAYPDPTVAKFNGQLPAYYQSRTNHTGSQTISTISDFPSQTGNSGKVLQTDGSVLSWVTPGSLGIGNTLNQVLTNGNIGNVYAYFKSGMSVGEAGLFIEKGVYGTNIVSSVTDSAKVDTLPNKSGTFALLSDTTSLSNRINLKLNISDTASMLTPYFREVGYGLSKTGQTVIADSAVIASKNFVNNLGALKVNISDTASMLANYQTAINQRLIISDTTGKWVSNIKRSNDSVFILKNTTWTFVYKDSTGGGIPTLQQVTTAGATSSLGITALNYTATGGGTYTSLFDGGFDRDGFQINLPTIAGTLALTSDTTNKWVQNITKNATRDSFYIWKNGTYTALKDSTGGGGSTETASNGLTKTVNDIALGGALTGNTTIDANSRTLAITATSLNPLTVTNTSTGNGIKSTSVDGYALWGISNNQSPLYISRNPASTNTNERIGIIERTTSGTATDGISGSLDFWIERSNNTSTSTNKLIGRLSNATFLSENSEFDITGLESSSEKTFANFQTGGVIRTNNNADTLSTKAYARSVGGGGGGSGTVTSVAKGFGLVADGTITTTGTVAVDSVIMATQTDLRTSRDSVVALITGTNSGTNTGDITLTTTGTSGVATLTGQALNIPNYTNASYSWSGGVIGTSFSATTATLNGTALQWTFTGSSPITWTLPSYAAFGNRFLYVKNIGSATLTVQRAGTDSIYNTSSVTSVAIAPGESASFSTAASSLTNTWTVLFYNPIVTGTNTGDQTITLTTDVTGSGTGSFATTIAAGAVTLAKMANIATSSLIYRKTAGTGVPEVNTLATLKTDLGLTGTNSGDQTSIVGITGTKAQFNTAVTDGDFSYTGDAFFIGTTSIANNRASAAQSLTGITSIDGSAATLTTGRTISTTGDVTYTSGSFNGSANVTGTATIANSAVTYAKIQNVSATDKVLGRVTAGAGVVEEISTTGSGNVVRATSPTLVTPVLGTPTSATLTNATGLPIGGISATGTPSGTTYLRGDGTWSTVTGTATTTTDNQFAISSNVLTANKAYGTLTITSGNTTWDASTGYDKKLTLTANDTLTITNSQNGDYGTLIVTQDATGGRTLKVPDATITLNTTASQETILSYTYDGTIYRWNVGATQAYSNASASVTGLLTSTDWTTFNGKQAALSGTGILSFSGTTPSYNTTSSSISGIISDETGTGVMVFGTSPDFTTGATIGGVAIPTISSTSTLTNKRIPQRVSTTASSATPTPNADTDDFYTITAQAAAAAFGAPTGTPTEGQKLTIRIKDDATARALTWNAIYRASTDQALPTTTVISKTMYIAFIYNATDTKWDCVAVNNGF